MQNIYYYLKMVTTIMAIKYNNFIEITLRKIVLANMA